jgi:hypothetical protein
VPGCSTCGYAVEWVRRSFRGRWRLYRDRPDILTRGRYVKTPEETPFYPGWHNLWSADWTYDRKVQADPPPLGEVRSGRLGYDKGGISPVLAPAALVGSADCVRHGDVFPIPLSVVRSTVGGFDSRCWSQLGLDVPGIWTATGGVAIGGVSAWATFTSWTATGGVAIGGVSAWAGSSSWEATGGVEIGGVSAWAGSPAWEGTGGVEVGGVSSWAGSPAWEATGGLVIDGVSGWIGPIPPLE